MTALYLLPAALSLIVLGAHFLRANHLELVGVSILMLAMIPLRRSWVARVLQVVLVLGAAEWVRTIVRLSQMRAQMGESGTRMVLILSGAALFTALSALVFFLPRVRGWYSRAPRGIE